MLLPDDGLQHVEREPGLSGSAEPVGPPSPQVKIEQGELLLVASDGREWHVVDALKQENQMTIISPGTQTAEYRIFKPDVGQPVVYVFTRGDDRSVDAEVLDLQLGRARRIRDDVG
jgi:hypothetical protein